MKHPKGGCLCGAVRYEVAGEVNPDMQFTCHCRDCQQVTGAGHARSMGVAADSVTWFGEPEKYEIQHEESVVDTTFCSKCGSPIYKATSNMPDFIFFHAGSLDLEFGADWSSKATAFPESRQAWDTLE